MTVRVGGARKARLSIPRVGKARNVTGRAGLAQAVATSPHTKATTPAQPSNASAPTTQSQPVDPFQTAAQPSGERFSIPSYTPQPGQADPRDATYWSQLAKLKFEDEQEYSKVEQEQARANSNYAYATEQAIRNRLGQQRGLGEQAMRGNLGASGWLNRTEGEETTQYTAERAKAQLSKEQEDQARLAAMHALQEGWGIDSAALLAEAAGRYAAGAGAEAENGEPEPSASSGPSGSTETGKWAFYPTPGSLPMNQKKSWAAKAFAKRIKQGKK